MRKLFSSWTSNLALVLRSRHHRVGSLCFSCLAGFFQVAVASCIFIFTRRLIDSCEVFSSDPLLWRMGRRFGSGRDVRGFTTSTQGDFLVASSMLISLWSSQDVRVFTTSTLMHDRSPHFSVTHPEIKSCTLSITLWSQDVIATSRQGDCLFASSMLISLFYRDCSLLLLNFSLLPVAGRYGCSGSRLFLTSAPSSRTVTLTSTSSGQF